MELFHERLVLGVCASQVLPGGGQLGDDVLDLSLGSLQTPLGLVQRDCREFQLVLELCDPLGFQNTSDAGGTAALFPSPSGFGAAGSATGTTTLADG